MEKHLIEVEKFFNTIKPFQSALNEQVFRCVLHRTSNGYRIIRSSLILRTMLEPTPRRSLRVDDFVCETFTLAEAGISPVDFMQKLIEGYIITPTEEFILDKPNNGRAIHEPLFYSPALQDTSRQDKIRRLLGSGLSSSSDIENERLTWEFRALETPYDGLNDLLADFGLHEHEDQFELAAAPIAYIDANSSVLGKTATLKIRAGQGVDVSKFSIGYIVLSRNQVIERGTLQGNDILWQPDETVPHVKVGSATLEVQPSSVVHCFANAFGICHHHYWVGDINAPENVQRAIFSVFDPSLGKLANLIARPNKRGNARNIEAAISWLLWMLGFSAVHMGDTEGYSDGPDILAMAPNGNILVVECTTGGLKDHLKMQKLLDRSVMIKNHLHNIGKSHLRVLPIMATTRPTTEVKGDLESFNKNGIVTWTQDDLRPALDRTLFTPDGNQNFDTLWTHMESALKLQEEKQRDLEQTISDVQSLKAKDERLSRELRSIEH
ncbi:hypothetical protein ACI2J4_03975 [Agrobacterium tumefaciens]|uniref:hypothetical protein n=1 Tax=Agrobacterium tumefaciens TaxID=358 RepID=UPI003850FB7F